MAALSFLPALSRPKFTYPGGRPGVDGSHPASSGIVLSCVPAANNLLNFADIGTCQNSTLTINNGGFTEALDGTLGPCVFNNSATTAFYSATFPNLTYTVATQATIYRPNTFGLTTHYHWLNCSLGGSNYGLIVNASGSVGFFAGSYLALQPLTANVPYFIAASYTKSGPVVIVVKNLDTGSVSVSSDTVGAVGVNDSSPVILGDSVGGSFGGNVSALMYSHVALTTQQLLDWAEDPWAFWYPSSSYINSPTISIVSGSTGSTGPASSGTTKRVRVISGTGTAGIKQVVIYPNVTGPTGAIGQYTQLSGFTGPTGTFTNVQKVNADGATGTIKKIIISGYTGPS